MAITAQLVWGDLHIQRWKLTQDGAAGDTVIITNAQILAGLLSRSPLYKYWDVAGLTLAQARDRFRDSGLSRALIYPTDMVGVITSLWNCTVTVDGNGRGQVSVFQDHLQGAGTGLLEIEYRHSAIR